MNIYYISIYYGIYYTPEFLIVFDLIYLRLDIIVIYNIWYLILATLQLRARLLELGRATRARRVELCE
jgi:hypothetical protein